MNSTSDFLSRRNIMYYLQEEEFYLCIYGTREGDTILFHHEGGVDVGDVDSKANSMEVKTIYTYAQNYKLHIRTSVTHTCYLSN